MLVRSILMDKQPGFYVDVGAHLPDRYSNTAWFYRHGWSGINVEANPDLAAKLRRARRRDVTVNCGVGEGEGEMLFFRFNEPAVSTFSPELAAEYEARANDWKVIDRIPVSVRSLGGILEEFVPDGTSIDFLSVDVEGMDLEVLRSNDWERFSPTIVLVECHGTTCAEVSGDPTGHFMERAGYVAVAKTFSTVVFMQRDAADARSGVGSA